MSEGNIQQSQDSEEFFAMPHFSAMAHEIKSPLALIRHLAMMIESGELSEVQVQELARRIQLTSERSLDLATNLACLGRPGELQTRFPLEAVNANAVCYQAIDGLRPLFRAKNFELIARYHRNPPLCLANSDLLSRVITNLADNALKYALEGGRVVIQTSRVRDGSKVRVAVRDYGPGVDSDLWQKIDQGVRNGHAPVSRRPESSGLGLYIAKTFTESMNAKIGIMRHRDGTTFFVDLVGSTQLRLV